MEENLPQNFDWRGAWERNKPPVILGFMGVVLVSIGVLSVLLLQQKEPEIEILPAEETSSTATLFIDLEGAVEKPGLYELPADSRLNDLLVRAGGLSAAADREWVETNLNLAQKIIDGAKIYIPEKGEAEITQAGGKVAGSSASLAGKININTAPVSLLDSLWGIGEKLSLIHI